MIEFDSVYIDEEAFETDYADGIAYHQAALLYRKENQRPSLVFNIAAVALERYLVALCDLYGLEPKNHNYITLMLDIEEVLTIPIELTRRIKAMDWIFGICSIDEYRHPNPDINDMNNVLILCDEVFKLFDRERIDALHNIILQERQNVSVD